MKYITGFFAFSWDFIVGDAWEVAAGVLALLALVFVLARYSGSASVVPYARPLPPLRLIALLSLRLLAPVPPPPPPRPPRPRPRPPRTPATPYPHPPT